MTYWQEREPHSRRSKLEMKVSMLKAIQKGFVKPTQMMAFANLSYLVAREMLRGLVEKGLVQEVADGKRRIYTLTLQGSALLSRYHEIEEALKP